jgi:hypothetical protein
MLDFEAFVQALAREMDLSEHDLRTMTFAELGFDSLRMLEVDLIVEELGALLPEDAFFEMEAVQDTFRAYQAVVGETQEVVGET